MVEKITLSTSAKIDRKKVTMWLIGLTCDIYNSTLDNAHLLGTDELIASHETTAIGISQKFVDLHASRR